MFTVLAFVLLTLFGFWLICFALAAVSDTLYWHEVRSKAREVSRD